MSEEERSRLAEVLKYAIENPYTRPMLEKVIDGELNPAGDDPAHVAQLKAFRVVLTVEEQPDGWMKHLSLSSIPGMVEPEHVNEIMQALEMSPLGTQNRFIMYAEANPRFGSVLNILEPHATKGCFE